jgi:hypothetical protein
MIDPQFMSIYQKETGLIIQKTFSIKNLQQDCIHKKGIKESHTYRISRNPSHCL